MNPPKALGAEGARRVLMTTEGTYPFVVGGVSSWCDALTWGIPELRWQILPIISADHSRTSLFELPSRATLMNPIELWSNALPPRGYKGSRQALLRADIPVRLVRGALGWDGDVEDLTKTLVWCRLNPSALRPTFRSKPAWEAFLAGLPDVVESGAGERRVPKLDISEAARLYQAMYWLGRTAAIPTPATDVLLATSAGWAAVPALVHRFLTGTPLLLVEHGVYVREAYLGNVDDDRYGARFCASRLARGVARAAYASADMVVPVADSHTTWERAFSVDRSKIRVIHNGVTVPDHMTSPPGNSTVVSVGRIDPLKDVQTMLRVAAEVIERVPGTRFLHYGPVPESRKDYGRECEDLHSALGLGDRFRFMGSTSDPHGAIRDADVALMTSISEGFPLAVLEAMAQARPVVSTDVGGVSDAVKGCGILAPAGDVYALTMGTCTLLRDPLLARRLGVRGYRRVRRVFSKEACVDAFRELFDELSADAGHGRPE